MPRADRLQIRAPADHERPWIADHLAGAWGSTEIVSRGVVHDGAQLPALLALTHGGTAIAGCATYHRAAGRGTELVTLDALPPGRGIGTALLHAVANLAARAGDRRLWLITTNDNLAALRFYQRRGLRLVAVHPGAVDAARAVKPSIPEIGLDGIPLHDELELELALSAAAGDAASSRREAGGRVPAAGSASAVRARTGSG